MKWSDELETPPWLWRQVQSRFKLYTDACASDKNHLCDDYFTIENSALEHSWEECSVWLNPPYSNPGPFLAKATESIITVALIKGDPSTSWWQKYVQNQALIYWFPKRIKFFLNDEPSKHIASFPSVLAIYLNIKQVG